LKFAGFISALLFVFIVFLSYNQKVFYGKFFELFSEYRYSKTGFQKVQEFKSEDEAIILPGLENKELFESIQDLSLCRNREVREYLYLYLTTGREYLVKSIERSYLYIEIINDIMKKNPDIPADIALLPLLESGFDPYAVSKSNAVGLWQFLQPTSAHLGLRSDQWIEERRDVEKSTGAAIRHLRYLHKILKSWDLALAAYNGGEGQINKAISRADSRNIWDLVQSGSLTRETAEFVPRYAALVLIYNNQRLFGIRDEIRLPEKVKTAKVKLNYRMNVVQISKICGITIDEINKYNPELNSSLTPPVPGQYSLRLTEESAKKFNMNLGGLYISMIAYPENYILTQLPSELLF